MTTPTRSAGPAEVIDLSPTEFKLLRYLMMNPNRVLSKAQILDHVWEYDFNGDASIVESYISYLRRKIDSRPEWPSLIQTKPGGRLLDAHLGSPLKGFRECGGVASGGSFRCVPN